MTCGRVHIWQVEGNGAIYFWENDNASNALVFHTPGNSIHWLNNSLHVIWHRFFMCFILYNGKLFSIICELDDGAVENDVGLICWKINFDRQCSFIVCSAHFNGYKETMLLNSCLLLCVTYTSNIYCHIL